MLSSAVKKYAEYYGVACGEKNIIFTNNDTGYETVLSLINKGIKVDAVIDIREDANSKIVEKVEKTKIKIFKGYCVTNTYGYKKIKSIEIMKLSTDGENVVDKSIKLSCDCLGISGGWTPAIHLFTQSGGKLKFKDKDQVFIPNTYPSDQV